MQSTLEQQHVLSDLAEVWKRIVTATDELGCHIAQSLRVLLWLEFYNTHQNTCASRLKTLLAGLRNLTRPRFKMQDNATRGRILICVPYATPAMINNIGPVVHEAFRRGRLGPIITGRRNVNYTREFGGYTPMISPGELIAEAKASERVAALRNGRRILGELIRSLDKHCPALSPKIKDQALKWFCEIVFSDLMGRVLSRFLAGHAPAAVISPSDFFPLEAQLCFQASRQGIPSMVLQHGISECFWWPFNADFDLLWGAPFKAEMVAMGAPEPRLATCGMVAADSLFRKRQNCQQTITDKTGFRCLVLSNTNARFLEPLLYEKFGILLKQTLDITKEITWQVKLHPNEDEGFYMQLGPDTMQRLEILPKSLSLEEAVTQSDAVCTVNSTAGLEAMIMNRPLVVFDVLDSVRKVAWWPSYGGGRFADTPETVADILEDLRVNRGFRRSYMEMQDDFLMKSFANPGKAAEAVVDFAEAMSR